MKSVSKAPRRVRSVVAGTPAPADHCDLSNLTDTLGFMIRACQLQTFRAFYREFEDVGLTPGSYAALAIIEANPGVRQGFVASILGFREPNMVRLVNELVEGGLIVRMAHEHDKRATGLHLTAQGIAFMNEINARVLKLDGRYTEGLTSQERDVLMSLLKKVLKNGNFLGGSVDVHES